LGETLKFEKRLILWPRATVRYVVAIVKAFCFTMKKTSKKESKHIFGMTELIGIGPPEHIKWKRVQ
jgi:hypothetical protein